MKTDRVLLSALIFSVAWHLFWLSALTVVVVPKDTKPPQFSNISFLGPILESSVLGVSSVRNERSAPEKRYLSGIEDLSVLITEKAAPDVYAEADIGAGTDIFEFDETLKGLAMPAIDGNKMEPGNSQ